MSANEGLTGLETTTTTTNSMETAMTRKQKARHAVTETATTNSKRKGIKKQQDESKPDVEINDLEVSGTDEVKGGVLYRRSGAGSWGAPIAP